MSRTQWWSLTALLAVVLGLLCGPVAFASGGAGSGPAGRVGTAGTASAAVEVGAASAVATAAVVDAAPVSAEAAPASAAPASAYAPPASVEAAPASADADGTRVPGCGKFRDHDGEPAVPSRARAGHDLAAGLAPWGLPEAGAPSAAPPAQIRARAPAPYTPTPVELSVLRV
ncbi:hypothetical protein ACIQ9M_25720 [Streptomyces californicus]|uniref:hypothetical protein n=1 Tax=Streptomyces californicus TaxID=67351 RepID=UPI0036A88630